ncbi:MAG: DUF2778 domain-containing protein [bacterium]|nr:DUF2778 domain-containing protein [bacterium]
MTASNPHSHIKKRLMKTVGAHTPCSCGYMQDRELYFYIKDYQGNVRVVLNKANQPVEVNSYYPYGGLMAATTTEGTQPYKYSTKELDRENGLDLYDSKARMYDPTIGRTPTLDPMAEKYYSMSPYLWCAANPVEYCDEFGDTINAVFDKSTNTLQILDLDRYDPQKPLSYVSSKDYDFNKNNQVLVIHNVFSGGKLINGKIVKTEKEHIPIPNGVYDILENKGDTNPKHKEWFRLDAQDDFPQNDKHDETGRNGFRLHTGTNSYGCITINENSKNSAIDWATLRKIIVTTSFTTVGERRGLHIFLPFDNLKKYGKISVHK